MLLVRGIPGAPLAADADVGAALATNTNVPVPSPRGNPLARAWNYRSFDNVVVASKTADDLQTEALAEGVDDVVVASTCFVDVAAAAAILKLLDQTAAATLRWLDVLGYR